MTAVVLPTIGYDGMKERRPMSTHLDKNQGGCYAAEGLTKMVGSITRYGKKSWTEHSFETLWGDTRVLA